MAKCTENIHHLYPTLKSLNAEELNELERKRVEIATNNRYTPEEDKIIENNFKLFFEDYGLKIDDEVIKMALGFFRCSKDTEYIKKKRELKRFLVANKFYKRLGEGLEKRTSDSVYWRARKVISPLRSLRYLSPEERQQIVQLKLSDPEKRWMEIAELYDADSNAVCTILRRTVDDQGNKLRRGFFYLDEDICLVNAIMSETKVKDISDVFHVFIPWTAVAKHVKHRSPQQCFARWKVLRSHIDSYVKPFLLNQKFYTDLDSSRLIYILYKERMKFDNITDIDWDWIKTKFAYVGSLDSIIRWWKCLVEEVPNNHLKSHYKIVKWLYKKKLPLLMKDTSIEQLQHFYEQSDL